MAKTNAQKQKLYRQRKLHNVGKCLQILSKYPPEQKLTLEIINELTSEVKNVRTK